MLAQVCKLSSLQEVKVEKFHELKVVLGYTMSSRPAWTTYNVLLLLKKRNKQIGKKSCIFLAAEAGDLGTTFPVLNTPHSLPHCRSLALFMFVGARQICFQLSSTFS